MSPQFAVSPVRRALLGMSASTAALASLGAWRSAFAQEARPLPAYAAWKDAGAMIVHSPNTIELRRSAMGVGVITPASQLYVRGAGDDLLAADVRIATARRKDAEVTHDSGADDGAGHCRVRSAEFWRIRRHQRV